MVRSSAGREFHDAGPEKEKARSPNLVCSRGVVQQKDEILELRIFSKKCRVYKILVAFAQRCVYNKSVGLYTRVCI